MDVCHHFRWDQYCAAPTETVCVDEGWLVATMKSIPARMRAERDVPVYINQWGVKGEVLPSRGRLKYAGILLREMMRLNISSSYWIWRAQHKEGRSLDLPVWGFELLRTNGQEVGYDDDMLAVLQEGFAHSPVSLAAPTGQHNIDCPNSEPVRAIQSAAAAPRLRDEPVGCHGWCIEGFKEDGAVVCQSSKCRPCTFCTSVKLEAHLAVIAR